jgi:hypothetical protein
MSKLTIPLDEDLRSLVRRASAIEAAPAGAKARVLSRVQALARSGGVGDGDAYGPGDASHPATALRSPFAGRALALAAAFALGAAAGAFVTYGVMRTRGSPEALRIASIERPLPTAPAPPVLPATPSTPPAEAHAIAGASHFDSVPKARERPVPVASASSPRPSSEATDPVADERMLLDLARGAIEREDGAAALAATEEHARKHPRGILVQEREAIAVRALVLLGRRDEARARLDRFREHFPDSLLLPPLESSFGREP